MIIMTDKVVAAVVMFKVGKILSVNTKTVISALDKPVNALI